MAMRSLTGFIVPPGWYGFIHAAGPGIVRRAMVDHEAGMVALARLGDPDPESRSKQFDGRRLVRVDRGFIVLNFIAYREKDASNASCYLTTCRLEVVRNAARTNKSLPTILLRMD